MATMFSVLEIPMLPDISFHRFAIDKPIAFAVLFEYSGWS